MNPLEVKANLLPCPITEDDKHRMLNDLTNDMQSFLQLRSEMLAAYTGERAEYVAALNEYIKAGLFVIAREFANIYDLAPIDH